MGEDRMQTTITIVMVDDQAMALRFQVGWDRSPRCTSKAPARPASTWWSPGPDRPVDR
jgi:hypothetical protein